MVRLTASANSFINDLRELSGNNPSSFNSNRYEVIEYHGPITVGDLEACGCDMSESADEDEYDEDDTGEEGGEVDAPMLAPQVVFSLAPGQRDFLDDGALAGKEASFLICPLVSAGI